MIRRSPAELYIKYLLVHPKGYSNEDIEDILTFAQLDSLGSWYLDRLRVQLQTPQPFHPYNKTHAASQTFLLQHGLRRLFDPDAAVSEALKVLKMPRVKEYVETTIIVNAPLEAVAYHAKRAKNFQISAEGLHFYKQCFWNTELLDSVELRALISRRAHLLTRHANGDIQGQAKAFQQASYNDPRRLAADMPASPYTAMIALMKLGFMPGKVELVKMAEHAKLGALSRVAESVFRDGPNDCIKAEKYAGVARIMAELVDGMVRPDQELREQLAAIALRTDENRVPLIHELSQGNHTVDMSPQPSKVNDRKET